MAQAEEEQPQVLLEELHKARREFQELLKSQGWDRLSRAMEDQLTARRNTLELTPLKSMDEVLEQEYKKGEISMLRLVLTLPGTVIETTTEQIKEIEDEDQALPPSP